MKPDTEKLKQLTDEMWKRAEKIVEGRISRFGYRLEEQMPKTECCNSSELDDGARMMTSEECTAMEQATHDLDKDIRTELELNQLRKNFKKDSDAAHEAAIKAGAQIHPRIKNFKN